MCAETVSGGPPRPDRRQIPDRLSLTASEAATTERIGHLPFDFAAAHAVLSLHRAANVVRGHLTQTVLRRHELTWTGFLVLWLLWIWRQLETREVAELAGISKATLTGVTATLVNRELVVRTPGTADRRLVVLSLSERGEELMAALYPQFNAAESEVVRDLSPAMLRTLTGALRQLVTTVEQRENSG